MSGAEDLARLTQTIDTANELFLSEEIKMVHVGGGVQRPTNAKVLADLSTQMSGALIYTTVALGLAGTPDQGYFSVASAAVDGYVTLYRNDGGTATFMDEYPNMTALRNISQLVQSQSVTAPETRILDVVDDEGGGSHLSLTSKRLSTTAFEIANDSIPTVITTDDGSVIVYVDDNRVIVGGEFEGERTDMPGTFSTDAEGGVLPQPGEQEQVARIPPFNLGLMFSPLIVTSDLYDQKLYAQNMLPRRQDATSVEASVASTTTAASEKGEVLTINGQQYGSGAVLNLRDLESPSTRRFMPLTLKNVPVQTVPLSPKILIIGDSICNRQGGYYLKQFLQALGLTPQFIGTMKGSAVASNAGDTTGELGEAREGWETGDYTNAITDRAIILPPGQEDAYKEMSKTDQRDRNPFARAATGSDPSSIVRNGYVFDPAFYQSRFGLATPDIVLQGLGTNDVRDRTAATIYGHVLSNDTIMHDQIRAAWPNAKIIRFVPGTAVSADRNALWTSHYLPLIRAMQKSIADRADAKTLLAPLWALTNPDVGYSFSAAGAAGEDGFYAVDWSDPVHPWQASRIATFQALAPYIAAAALNLI
ncbi:MULTISPECIES: SGNH/GDSL hydrolase family protein [unclassified Pseudomonas]|uniref:SGNH/GDSL hydrolase family protein n=1 Tax=unclassified Pseudomonas TaxID=196821 RepID=UPI002114F447|nr:MULTISPECIES: SGNH/GDSL hydrolase family protein [unclassified Pseudomonas]